MKSILDARDDHKPGYFVACDLEYPPKIHRKQNIFQFVHR